MQQPSSSRRRTKAAVGLGLAAAAALGATGITVALAEDNESAAASEAATVAEARADELPHAARAAWMNQVGDYVETVQLNEYAAAVYANLVGWHNAAEYAEAVAAASAPAGTGSYGSSLAAIRQCESGGDYSAVSSSGTYRGAYQFDQATWESMGGTGDPAAASPAEQDMRAQMLYEQSGSSPWPVCGS
jgi:glycine/D-amino acid oxidase-like deaminating enzyme